MLFSHSFLSSDVASIFRYYCALDGDGRRLDLARRPELSHGSVEFLVSAADYSVRAPQVRPILNYRPVV